MNEAMQDPNFGEQGEAPAAGETQQKRRGYSNPLYASDSLTSCTAFISEIKSHGEGEEVLISRAWA